MEVITWEEQQMLAQGLPPLFAKADIGDQIAALSERGKAIMQIAVTLGLNPRSSVQTIMAAIDRLVQPCAQSTAEIDVSALHDMALTAKVNLLETENQELKAKSERLEKLVAMRSACSALARNNVRPKLGRPNVEESEG